MNFDLVPRRYRVTNEHIDDGDMQAIITPLWWEVSIYDGETEMMDALERFTDAQKIRLGDTVVLFRGGERRSRAVFL